MVVSAPLRSMTGFARADGVTQGYRWTWELKSVNGKGLDLRFRLPPGYDDVEPLLRERTGGRLQRGNVQASLSLQRESGASRLRLNEAVLAEVLEAVRRIGARVEAAPPTLDGLLGIRGVLEMADEELDAEQRAVLVEHVVAGFDAALAGLVEMREREGAALAAILHARIDEIGRLAEAAEASPARSTEAIRARLADQVAALLDAAPALDPARLQQEAALIATRADIREELDRLKAHVAAARELIAKGSPAGRQLDFLSQEFNRESNTLCSKSNDRSITAIGLDLKVVVDQLREQVQNVE